MGIGGALAEARTEAGLTVTQVSDRTRIREKIIRDIEHDDYSACGGDYYARGHIRAIARVVGTDPVPLIEEYDAARMPPEPAEPEPSHEESHGWRIPGMHRGTYGGLEAIGLAGNSRWEGTLSGTTEAGNGVARNSVASNRYGSAGLLPDPELDADADTDTDLYDPGTLEPEGTVAERGAAILESATRWAGSARSRLARQPEPVGGGVPGGITAAEAFRPGMPLEPIRRRRRGAGLLALIVLAAIGVLVYMLVAGGSKPAPAHAASHHSAGTTSAKHPSSAKPPSGNSTAKAEAHKPVPATLTAVRATAFGPGGVAHGDNPQQASRVLDRRDSAGWHTDWYATARFGNLQSGTGLLLNMGKPVAVTSARIQLGSAAGGAVELRAGNRTSLRHLHVVAQAANPGGSLTLPVSSPVTARYLLIWFTTLPPDDTAPIRPPSIT